MAERPLVAARSAEAIVREAFHHAERAAGGEPWAVDLLVADRRIHLRVAGTAARAVVEGPLRHLVVPAGAGPLHGEIRLWDAAESGVPLPEATASRAIGAGWAVGIATAPTVLRYPDGPMLVAWDPDERVATVGIGGVGDLPPWERAAPLRVALHLVLQDERTGFSHAAAVAPPGRRGVLLTGPGGSGKSTTALAAASLGWDLASEDYVLADLRGDGVRAWSLYATAKLDAPSLALLPELRAATTTPPVDQRYGPAKAVVDLPTLRPDLPSRSVDVAALVSMSADGPDEPTPIRAVDAVRALAPTSVLQLPGDRHGLARAASISRRVPCFALGRRRPPRDVVAALAALCAELG